jgi:hypothetical protein
VQQNILSLLEVARDEELFRQPWREEYEINEMQGGFDRELAGRTF